MDNDGKPLEHFSGYWRAMEGKTEDKPEVKDGGETTMKFILELFKHLRTHTSEDMDQGPLADHLTDVMIDVMEERREPLLMIPSPTVHSERIKRSFPPDFLPVNKGPQNPKNRRQ